MVKPPQVTSQRTARERPDREEGPGLDACGPVRLLVAASIILPIAIFLFAAWLSYHQHLAEARDRVQRNLNTVYEHALKVFETFELSARYLDELTGGHDRRGDPKARSRIQRHD